MSRRISQFLGTRVKTKSFQTRPWLEALEDRFCPTAPVITNLNVINLQSDIMQVAGTVEDSNPSTVSITFSGVLSGSAVTYADGAFLYSGPASGAGSFSATATDSAGLSSNPVYGAVPGYSQETGTAPTGPTITSLSVISSSDSMVQVEGIVQGPNPQTMIVNFNGALTGSAAPDANGVFCITGQLNGTGAIYAEAIDGWGQTSWASCALPYGYPLITNLQVTNVGGTTVTVTGVLEDYDPSSATVAISGVVNGSATPNPDGSFSFTGQATGLGAVTVQATDSWQLTSQIMYGEVVANSPVITKLTAQNLGGGMWLFTGVVSDASPASAQVQFTCSDYWNGTTVNVASDGSFALIAWMSTGDMTQVSAQATNTWGLKSSSVSPLSCTSAPVAATEASTPELSNFKAVQCYGTYWEFTGTVQDAPGMDDYVVLGGAPSVNGLYLPVNADGQFDVTIRLAQGETGGVTSQAFNNLGMASDVAMDLVG